MRTEYFTPADAHQDRAHRAGRMMMALWEAGYPQATVDSDGAVAGMHGVPPAVLHRAWVIGCDADPDSFEQWKAMLTEQGHAWWRAYFQAHERGAA